MDFCYLLQDPKRRHQPGDQAWATTIVMVDVAAPRRHQAGTSRCEICPWSMALQDHGIRRTCPRERDGIVYHEDSATSSKHGAETCRLGERFARNSVEQACRTPSGKTSQNRSSRAAKKNERPSGDADERRSAEAQDLNPPAVHHVIRVPRAGDTENEPSSSSSRPMETEDGGVRGDTASDDLAQVRSPAPAPNGPTEQTDQSD